MVPDHHRLDVRCDLLRLQLTTPFTTARGTRTSVSQIVVEARQRGTTGFGTAVLPTGTGAIAEEEARLVLAGVLAGERDTSAMSGRDAPAILALDMALHDLGARRIGVSLRTWLGAIGPGNAQSAISLGVSTPEAASRAVEDLAPWPVIKLKLSSSDDLRVVHSVRARYPGRLWIDANGALPIDEAISVGRELRRLGVTLFEQPIAPGTPELLEEVERATRIKVVADEDCRCVDDVRRLAGRIFGVNVKIAKLGGLLNARDAMLEARRHGLAVILGCQTESALGVTAAAHLIPLADALDLDGHLRIADDPFVGLSVTSRRVALPRGPGLGVTRDPASVVVAKRDDATVGARAL